MLLEIIIAVLALLIASFILNFYRDPKRTIPKGNNIVSPADGTIIRILDTSEIAREIKFSALNQNRRAISERSQKSMIFETSSDEIELTKGMLGKIRTMTKDISKECYVISIFMSPLNAHINRAPIAGKIISIKHTKGRFFKAYDLNKSFENEKNEIVIENKNLKIKVIQIAGFLARRIICGVKLHQKVNKGGKIGMIALGSQATIIMPKSVSLKIKMNDKVKAGESVIAGLK